MSGVSAWDKLGLALSPSAGGGYTLNLATVAGGATPASGPTSVWDKLNLALVPTGAADGGYTLNAAAISVAQGGGAVSVDGSGNVTVAAVAGGNVNVTANSLGVITHTGPMLFTGTLTTETSAIKAQHTFGTGVTQIGFNILDVYTTGGTFEQVGHKWSPVWPGTTYTSTRVGGFITNIFTMPSTATWNLYIGFGADVMTVNGIVPSWRDFQSLGIQVGAAGNVTEFIGYLSKPPSANAGTLTTSTGFKADSTWGSTIQNSIARPIWVDGGQTFLNPTYSPASSIQVAGMVWDGVSIGGATLTLPNTTAITQTDPGVSLMTLYQPTVSGGLATVTVGSTLTITGAPLVAGAGPDRIQQVYHLNMATRGTTVNNAGPTKYYVGNINAHTVTLSQTTNLNQVPGVAGWFIGAITVTAASGTPTVTATGLYAAAPIQGANVTLTNTYAGLFAGMVANIATRTLAGAVTDDFTASLRITPTLDQAFTVTRYNYLDFNTPTLTNSAVVTDAAVMRFDAAPGTHKALAANAAVATVLGSVGPTGAQTTVQGWLKINVNGTLRYVPFF